MLSADKSLCSVDWSELYKVAPLSMRTSHVVFTSVDTTQQLIDSLQSHS